MAIVDAVATAETAAAATGETTTVAAEAAAPAVTGEAAEVVEAPAAGEVAVVDPKIEEEAAKASADAELLALEEELAVLEREEEARKVAAEAETLDVSSDDLWQVDGGKSDSAKGTGGIRFAEDIAGFRETDAGRRGGRRGGSSARNRRR